MSEDLPFLAEYAKSGRASCKGCKKPIAKETLRLAILVQSQHFDGKTPNWHHFDCFFKNARLKSTSDLEHFLDLRAEDQEKIKNKIANTSSAQFLNDYSIEYAKSGRSMCRACEQKIPKDEIRICRKEYGGQYGPKDLWHHFDCFVKNRDSLDYDECGSKIPGFKNLKEEDKESVKSKLPNITPASLKRKGGGDDQPVKKQKLDEENLLKEQSKIIYSFRDPLQQFLEKKQLQFLLEYNDQQLPTGEGAILDALADCMSFGALLPCEECKEGQLVHRTEGYRCRGNLTEWTKCVAVTKTPKRKEFKIPEELLQYDFLANYKYVERERLFPTNQEKSKSPPQSDAGTSSSTLPLSKCMFVFMGKLGMAQVDAAKVIEELGGKVVSNVSSVVLAVVSTKEEVAKMSKKMIAVKDADVHVVSVDFIKKVKDATNIEQLIKDTCISTWGGSLTEKLNQKNSAVKSGGASKAEAKFAKSGPSTMKLTIKGRSAVDPESGLEDSAHVLEEKKSIYSAVLGLVNIAKGANSFYKLQLLESDKHDMYWVFRAWGRVGTTIGGNKVEGFDTKEEAKGLFTSLYEEKTGNLWSNREKFEKRPGKMYPMDIDYGQDDEVLKKIQDDSEVKSKLHKSIQELIKTIFDVESMKAAMVEYEIDLNKMPLGKLSRRQIEKAYSVLTEVQDLIKSGGTATKFLDASNRFFTLIPHDFGMKTPPLLNSEEILKAKMEMLDNLLDIEVAYSLLKNVQTSKDKSKIDSHYDSLNTTIEVMDKADEEFKIIGKYVKNTHAATHSQYKLKLEEVFKIERKGERSRFKAFKKLPNRQLLWHGSRTTNYAGILSQGLRIAPPEAPVTGYMFGKGVYFADMVSKSANYCNTTKQNPTGLLMLCEVALGNMHELKNATFVEKLPPGKHSVKGIGKTEPDAAQKVTIEDGIEVPLGTPKETKIDGTTLLYNEYIVYDVSQINIKYLLKVNFQYK